MAYRNPRYSWSHALRDAPLGNVTTDDSSDAARLYDSAIQPPFTFDSAGADHWVAVDLGAGFAVYGRMLIPAGHDLNGTDWVVEQSAAGDYMDTVELGSGTFATDGLLDVSFTASSAQFIRLRIATSGQWTLTELWFTQTHTTTRGPDDSFAEDQVTAVNTTRLSSNSGYALKRAPKVWELRYAYRRLPAADALTLRTLRDETNDGTYPFWAEMTDSTTAPVLVRLTAQLGMQNDSPAVRAEGPRYKATVSLSEEIA